MKAAIIDKSERYFTYLLKLFNGISNAQKNYNWLITDCECYPQNKELEQIFGEDEIWLSGEELTEIIQKTDFQFVWAVFSGFSKDISLEEIRKYKMPYANGNEALWSVTTDIQHPLADIEIIAWDSSLTIFLSKNEDLVESFMKSYPLSEGLSEKNRRENAEVAHIGLLSENELGKNNVVIDEKRLHTKYDIWRALYQNNDKEIDDEQILQCIRRYHKT